MLHSITYLLYYYQSYILYLSFMIRFLYHVIIFYVM